MTAVGSLDDLVADLVATQLASAIERAERRGEDRARALRTHLSIPEAAMSLGISERHCRKLVADGTIPSLPLGNRLVVPRLALEQLGMPAVAAS